MDAIGHAQAGSRTSRQQTAAYSKSPSLANNQNQKALERYDGRGVEGGRVVGVVFKWEAFETWTESV